MKLYISLIIATTLASLVGCSEEQKHSYQVEVIDRLSDSFKGFIEDEGDVYESKKGLFDVKSNENFLVFASSIMSEFSAINNFSDESWVMNREKKKVFCCSIQGYEVEFFSLIYGKDFVRLLEEDIEYSLKQFLEYRGVHPEVEKVAKIHFRSSYILDVSIEQEVCSDLCQLIADDFFSKNGINYLGKIPSPDETNRYFSANFLSQKLVRNYLENVKVFIQ